MKHQRYRLLTSIIGIITACSAFAEQVQKTTGNQAADASQTTLTLYRETGFAQQHRTLSVDNHHSPHHRVDKIPTSIFSESLMITPGDANLTVIDYVLSQDPCEILLTLEGVAAGHQTNLRLHYAFGKISWKALYNLHFSQGYERVQFCSWIDIHNESGVDFPKALVQLIDAPLPLTSTISSQTTQLLAPPLTNNYVFSAPISVPAQGSKRFNWATAHDITVKQDYRLFVGGDYLKDMNGVVAHPMIETWVSFANTTENGLGHPLPPGEATISYQDDKGWLEVLGRAPHSHTSTGGDVSLRVPVSTTEKQCLSAEHKKMRAIETELNQIEFKKLSDTITEANYRLSIKNKNDQAMTVRIMLDFPQRMEWTVIRENIAHQKGCEDQIYWQVQVPANAETDLKYRVRLIQE